MSTETATPFTTAGLSLGHRKFHKWASKQAKDASGFVLVYGPATGNETPWTDVFWRLDQILVIVRYSPATGMFDVHIQGRRRNDTETVPLPDGRTVESITYPHQKREEFSLRDLPEGAKAFLMKHMN